MGTLDGFTPIQYRPKEAVPKKISFLTVTPSTFKILCSTREQRIFYFSAILFSFIFQVILSFP